MDRKKTKTDFHRKSRSTSRVSARSIYAKKTVEEEPVPPNTQVFTPKHMPKLTSTVLPFGKPSLKKASTTRQRRRHHSTIPPVRRSLLEKRDSDSSSSHSVQDQQSKLKITSTRRAGPKRTGRARWAPLYMRSSSITRATEGFGVVPSAVTLYLMAALELAEMQENFSERVCCL
ncbi:hypothetical protein Y032_0023g660 [Ancylostoma ceylanicum]|uniref:Uncharacterized protein n=1 Tax=Ancylostoma ceylanicum TaxID=53326 RepID=A0A016UW83_9BILA|nr:hypothetical protein Y032_0023g660 [Ancylostoma ceylanicum]